MHISHQPIAIQDPTFNQLLKRVNEQDESLVVEGENNSKAALVPLWLFKDVTRQRAEAKSDLFALIDELRKKNAHRDPEEIEREVDAAVEAVRYGKPHS